MDKLLNEEAYIQEGRRLFAERERIEKLGRIRQLVFGSMDGLLVPLGVVSGVAGGTLSTKAVLIAGIAEAFAGALSMGAGEFIAGRSEAQVHLSEVERERDEIRRSPRFELDEMARLLVYEGVGPEDAGRIAGTLARYPHAYAKTMVEKELGIDIAPKTVKVAEAVTMALSYLVASIVPLIAYFFLPVGRAFPVSLVLSFVALIVIGVAKGKLAATSVLRSAAEIVLVGLVSGGGGYLLGSTLPRLLGY